MAVRSYSPGEGVSLSDRPFAGDLGANLYVGTSRDMIRYGHGVSMSSTPEASFWPFDDDPIDLEAEDIPAVPRVATVTSPDNSLEYTLPPELVDTELWYQVRTYQDDHENETVYRAQRLVTDGDGNDATPVVGTARIVSIEKRDGGGMRLSWSWTPSRDGVQPTSFTVSKSSGSGSISPVSVILSGERIYQADVIGLTDGVAYTFQLDAVRELVSTTLISGIAFTGDNAGPPAVSGLVAVEM